MSEHHGASRYTGLLLCNHEPIGRSISGEAVVGVATFVNLSSM